MCGLCIDLCTSRRYSCKFASSVFSAPVESLLHCRLWNACSGKWFIIYSSYMMYVFIYVRHGFSNELACLGLL